MINNEIKRILLGSALLSTILSLTIVGLTLYHHQQTLNLINANK